MRKIKIIILSWLLHHANRHSQDQRFYSIKSKILEMYGKLLTYDIQFIEGKHCFTCSGTAIYDIDDYGDVIHCRNCAATGWYKRPVWNYLKKIELGNYIFHTPYERVYYKPDNSIPIIKGYIDHYPSKYGKISIFILFLFYDRQFIKRKLMNIRYNIKMKFNRCRYFFTHELKFTYYKSADSNELPF